MRSKGEGSVYQRGDGKWVAQVDAGAHPTTGRRKYMRRVRGSKRDAVRALSDLRREVQSPAARDRITVGDWCATWLVDLRQQVAAGQKAVTTVVGYESHVRLYIGPTLGQVRLDQLAPGHVSRMITGILAQGRKAGTARSVRATLSTALSAAIADGLLEVNVARAAKPPAKDRTVPSSFSDDELDRFLEVCQQHRLGRMFELGLLTGMRASELRGLRWSDVDLDAATYQVAETLHRVGPTGAAAAGVEPGLVVGDPKTSGSGDETPLSPTAVELLRAQRRVQAEERLAASSWGDGDLVFASRGGTPLDPSNVTRAWSEILAGAEVPAHTADGRGRGLHELRRTFTTRLRKRGVSVELAQRLGRWASPAVLLAHYSAVDDAGLREAADVAAEGLVK